MLLPEVELQTSNVRRSVSAPGGTHNKSTGRIEAYFRSMIFCVLRSSPASSFTR